MSRKEAWKDLCQEAKLGLRKWIRKVEPYQEVLTSVAAGVAALQTPLGARTALSAGIHGVEALINWQRQNDSQIPEGWTPSDLSAGLNEFIVKEVITSFEMLPHKFRENAVYRTSTGQEVIIAEHSFYYRGDRAALLLCLADALWHRYGTSMSLLASHRSSWDPNGFNLAPYQSLAIDSPKAQEIEQWLKPFLEAGDNRAVILHGRPGAGKSVTCNYLAKRFSDRTLHIPASAFGGLQMEVIWQIIELLSPKSVIINDIDWSGSWTGSLLHFLERVNEKVPLLLATANQVDRMPTVVIRDGRFHRLFQVDSLGTDLLHNLADHLTPEELQLAATLPLSSQVELHKRARRLGELFSAKTEMEEIIYRIDLLKRKEEQEKPQSL